MTQKQLRIVQQLLATDLVRVTNERKLMVTVGNGPASTLRIGPGSVHQVLDERAQDIVEIMTELDRKYCKP